MSKGKNRGRLEKKTKERKTTKATTRAREEIAKKRANGMMNATAKPVKTINFKADILFLSLRFCCRGIVGYHLVNTIGACLWYDDPFQD